MTRAVCWPIVTVEALSLCIFQGVSRGLLVCGKAVAREGPLWVRMGLYSSWQCPLDQTGEGRGGLQAFLLLPLDSWLPQRLQPSEASVSCFKLVLSEICHMINTGWIPGTGGRWALEELKVLLLNSGGWVWVSIPRGGIRVPALPGQVAQKPQANSFFFLESCAPHGAPMKHD